MIIPRQAALPRSYKGVLYKRCHLSLKGVASVRLLLCGMWPSQKGENTCPGQWGEKQPEWLFQWAGPLRDFCDKEIAQRHARVELAPYIYGKLSDVWRHKKLVPQLVFFCRICRPFTGGVVFCLVQEALGYLEMRHIPGRDCDCFVRLWILAGALCAMCFWESSEADKRNLVAFLYSLPDGSQNRVYRSLRLDFSS